jgi:signal-transduction protein with cAMP-binding, CBS, and nucleotidyltransferase domain
MTGKVGDVMTPEPIGVYYDQTIADAARVMRDVGVGAVLVVRGTELAGVVTDRDLVVRGVAAGGSPSDPVGPLCTGELVGVSADDDTSEAERVIRHNAVRRLPVIDDGQVSGIVSLGDLAIARTPDSVLADLSQAAPNI